MADMQQDEDDIRLFSSLPRKKARKAADVEAHGNAQGHERRQKASDEGVPGKLVRHVGPRPEQAGDEPDTFEDLGVSEHLCSIVESLGIVEPTAVQKGCIPAIISGRNVIGVAQTGSGKTAAFALPVLHALSRNPYGVFNLVLTPTRELAFQIADQYKAFGAGQNLRVGVVVGGLNFQEQAKQLERRPHVVIATPGRLKALIDGDSSLGDVFKRTAFLILDEADRLLDQSFEEDLGTILACLPAKRQTLLFSATMTKALVTLQEELLDDAFVFEAYEGLQTASGLRETVTVVPAKVKEVYLTHLLRSLDEYDVRSVMVFTGTRKSCQSLVLLLDELEIPVTALHSGITQRERMASLDRFKSGRVSILVCTDVASRGLDIPEVDLVVNFDLPKLPSDYVHRVGRTARAGRSGWSLSFASQYDIELLKAIERETARRMEAFHFEEKKVLSLLSAVYQARRVKEISRAKKTNKKGEKR